MLTSENDGTQHYLVFQMVYNYCEMIADHISTWKSKGLSKKCIKPHAASNNSLAPVLNQCNTKL